MGEGWGTLAGGMKAERCGSETADIGRVCAIASTFAEDSEQNSLIVPRTMNTDHQGFTLSMHLGKAELGSQNLLVDLPPYIPLFLC